MKIAAVTPPDAASDPRHPDHDRWVKERTLKMEIEHAQLVGLTLRDAEAENARMLARAEQMAKESPPAIKTKAPVSRDRELRHAARGISRRAPKKAAKPECACGLCVPCRRKMRVLAIFQRRQDPAIKAFGDNLFTSFLAAATGKGEFAGLRPKDAKRALTARIDRICDSTVFLMGAWR